MKKGKRIIAIVSVIAILIYVICSVYMLLTNPTDTYIVKQGSLSEEDECIGYIIRKEKIKLKVIYCLLIRVLYYLFKPFYKNKMGISPVEEIYNLFK